MTFTDQLYELATPLWRASYEHAFIRQISDGTLPPAIFRFYLLQDWYYLSEFGKLHRLIADQLDDATSREFLLAGAQGLKEGEVEIREGFFETLQISTKEIKTTPVAPTTYNYVNHMYAALNRGGTASAVAGLLPCYWLYNEIGKRLEEKGSPNPLYQDWIDTYGSAQYEDSVMQMKALTNRLATPAKTAEQQAMQTAFIRSSAYELAFWQMAMDQENWGIKAAP